MPVVGLNNNNFKQVVIDSEKPILIDFWAEWCGPCRKQLPIIEQLADELKGTVIIAKINVDENPELCAQFSVMSIPTLVMMKKGEIIGRRTGVTPKEVLLDMLNLAKK